MQRAPRAALASLPVAPHAELEVHAHAALLRPGLHEGPIEKVTVVGDVDAGLHLAHVIEPAPQQRRLVGLVPHDERPGVLRLGVVLEVVDVGTHHLAVDDQIALTVQHVRDHKHLIVLGVGKLERQLGGLDVERADLDLTAREHVTPVRQRHLALHRLDLVPPAAPGLGVDEESHVIRDVVLADVHHGIRVVGDGALALGGLLLAAAADAVVRAARVGHGAGLHLVQRLVRLRRFGPRLVLLHHRQHLAPDVHQVLDRRESHLEVLLRQTRQVVLEVQIFLVLHRHVQDLTLVPAAKKRLDVVFAVGFGGEEKVRGVPDLRLEGLAVLLHEVAVDGAELLAGLGLLNGGLDRVGGEGFGP